MSRRIHRSKSRSPITLSFYSKQRRQSRGRARYLRPLTAHMRGNMPTSLRRSRSPVNFSRNTQVKASASTTRTSLARSKIQSPQYSLTSHHKINTSRVLRPHRSSSLRSPQPSFDPSHEFGGSQQWGDVPTGTSPTDWPQGMGPVLVISIRPERMNKFAQRMGPWMKHMKRFPATDGRTINTRQWVASRKVLYTKMTPGQMGCYDSHVRIWETIARSPHSVVTVLEDDVDWCTSNVCAKINQSLEELKRTHVSWDWLCWGHGPWAFDKNSPVQGLSMWRKPGMCQGFFAYTLTRSMAQKLVSQCRPYKGPAVDKWFYDEFVKKNNVNALCIEPRLCWVVSGESDTDIQKMRR